jgi:hypothetical protein
MSRNEAKTPKKPASIYSLPDGHSIFLLALSVLKPVVSWTAPQSAAATALFNFVGAEVTRLKLQRLKTSHILTSFPTSNMAAWFICDQTVTFASELSPSPIGWERAGVRVFVVGQPSRLSLTFGK